MDKDTEHISVCASKIRINRGENYVMSKRFLREGTYKEGLHTDRTSDCDSHNRSIVGNDDGVQH